MNKVFIIGNGPSRKNINISLLRQEGKVYGTNLLFLESPVDSIVSIDPIAEHKVYHSGYAYLNKCYLADWTPIPEMMYDDIVSSMPVNKDNIIQNKKNDSTEFVIHASKELKQPKNEPWRVNTPESIYISWVKEDKVENIDVPLNSAGGTALITACKKENPQQVYMMGMDFFAWKDIYGYPYIYHKTPIGAPTKWLNEFKSAFQLYPNIEFIQVNINRFEEWEDVKNLTYLDSYEKE